MEQNNLTQTDNRNYLMLIGIGVFLCLLILTAVSILDLNRDYSVNNTASINNPEIMSKCISCGAAGIPHCFYCGCEMQWNPSAGEYSCPACQRSGQVMCPRCGKPMQPVDQSVSQRGL